MTLQFSSLARTLFWNIALGYHPNMRAYFFHAAKASRPRAGRVDFMCYPEFDSPSIFASILDKDKGGDFSIRPAADNVRSKQMYYPNTNILLTRFMKTGILEITDFIPIHEGRPVKALARRMKSLKGKTTVCYKLAPRFAYGKTTPSLKEEDEALVFRGDHAKNRQACLKVYSNRPLGHSDGGD